MAPQWQPHHYTVLFFHDEAVAMAAGHRPCALCRWSAFEAYRSALGRPTAPDLDDRLHAERWDGGRRRLHRLPWASLPPGAFVLADPSVRPVHIVLPVAGALVVGLMAAVVPAARAAGRRARRALTTSGATRWRLAA